MSFPCLRWQLALLGVLLLGADAAPIHAADCSSYLQGARQEEALANGPQGSYHAAAAQAYRAAYAKCLASQTGGGGLAGSVYSPPEMPELDPAMIGAAVQGIMGLIDMFGNKDSPRREAPSPEAMEREAARERVLEERRQAAAAEQERQDVALGLREYETRAQRAADRMLRQLQGDYESDINDIIDGFRMNHGLNEVSPDPLWSIEDYIKDQYVSEEGLSYVSDRSWRDAIANVTDQLTDSARSFLRESVQEELFALKQDLIDEFGRDYLELEAGSFGQNGKNPFEQVFGSAVSETKTDIAKFVNESLRSSSDRVRGVPWGGWVGDRLVQKAVGRIVDEGVRQTQEQFSSKLLSEWKKYTSRQETPALLDPVEAAEQELWKAASVPNLIQQTFPFRGIASVRGLTSYMNNVTDKWAQFFGLATDRIMTPMM